MNDIEKLNEIQIYFGQNLKYLRLKQNKTLESIQNDLSISKAVLSQYENEYTTEKERKSNVVNFLKNLRKLSEDLSVSIFDLLYSNLSENENTFLNVNENKEAGDEEKLDFKDPDIINNQLFNWYKNEFKSKIEKEEVFKGLFINPTPRYTSFKTLNPKHLLSIFPSENSLRIVIPVPEEFSTKRFSIKERNWKFSKYGGSPAAIYIVIVTDEGKIEMRNEESTNVSKQQSIPVDMEKIFESIRVGFNYKDEYRKQNR